MMGGPLLNIPSELHRLILEYLPLLTLARLASTSKDFWAAYWGRVQERDRVVATRVKSDFTAEFREGLSPADTALPRDLHVDPPVRAMRSFSLQNCWASMLVKMVDLYSRYFAFHNLSERSLSKR
jgi:hypothetical protein